MCYPKKTTIDNRYFLNHAYWITHNNLTHVDVLSVLSQFHITQESVESGIHDRSKRRRAQLIAVVHPPKWWAWFVWIWMHIKKRCSNMFNHLGSLSLHKFTRLYSLSVTFFLGFRPWYLLELPLHDCQLRSPVPQVGIGSGNHGSCWTPMCSLRNIGLDTNPSIEILCVQESSPISNYIISYIYIIGISMSGENAAPLCSWREEKHTECQEDPL